MSFAKESRDLLIECCVEFITMISSEANEIAEKDAKKTIACEHITKALEELGFAEYVPDLLEVAQQFKTQQVVCCTHMSRIVQRDSRGRRRLTVYRRERRNKAKSNKADCQKRSYLGSRRNCSVRRHRNSTLVLENRRLRCRRRSIVCTRFRLHIKHCRVQKSRRGETCR